MTVGPHPINLRVRGFRELTISMAECEGLALVTLARIKNWVEIVEGPSKGCDTCASWLYYSYVKDKTASLRLHMVN